MTARPFDEVFRDFVIEGMPASGPHYPIKKDIRDSLNAQIAGPFPDNRVIKLNNANEGTPNNIIVSAAVAIPSAVYQVLYILNVTQENTGAVTVSGAINRALVTNTSQPVPNGYLKPGMALLCIDTGTALRLLSYGDAEAILAAAEAAADRAEDAAVAAEEAAGGLLSNFASRADVQVTTIPSLVAYLRTAGYSTAGDGGGALYKRAVLEPSHAGKVQSADGAWWELAENEVNPKQFGAKGDFKQIITTNSAGSAVVTSIAGAFRPAHVGCQITIQTGAGTTIRRSVVAYVSDSQVTVNSTISTAYADAVAYVGTLDTGAVNKCFTYAVAKNVAVRLNGVHIVGNISVTNGPITIRGTGPHNSGFVVDDPTANFSIANSGSPYAFPYNGTLLADFSVRGGFEANTSEAMLSYVATMTGSPQRYVMIENINVNTLGSGFNCGIQLKDASNYSTRDVQIAGYGPIRSGSVGLRVRGTLQPIDMYNVGLKVYFCDVNIEIYGEAVSGSTMEAIVFSECISIFCNYGLRCQHDTYMPYLAVMDSNINGYKRDIVASNVTQIKIDNNLFYSADRMPHEANWMGVEIGYSSATALSNPSNNTITNNTFSGDNTPSVDAYGIVISASSPKNVMTQVDGNHFLGVNYGVRAYTGVTGVFVMDTNVYDRVVNKVMFDTKNGNIDGSAERGVSGSVGMNAGHTIRYGTITATVGTGNRVNVTYSKAMPSATRVVTLEVGVAASAGDHAVDGKSANGFSAYLPGATIGSSITFDYIALGE